jgi:hypothetical protein
MDMFHDLVTSHLPFTTSQAVLASADTIMAEVGVEVNQWRRQSKLILVALLFSGVAVAW